MSRLHTILLVLSVILLQACKEEYAPAGVAQKTDIPHAIASIEQSKSASEANIVLKFPQTDGQDFQLEMLDNAGGKVPLTAGADEVAGKFNLRNFAAAGLKSGETYTLQLTYTDQQKKQVTTSRTFTAKAGAGWRRLPHIPVASGDYTGAAVLSSLFNSQMAVYRYQNARSWDILKFVNGKWESSESAKPVPRHNAIAFPLSQLGGRELIFMGFGYLDNDKLPGKKAYLNDFWWTSSFYYIGQHSGIVFPVYEGMDRDVKFFLTYDKAYLLKENHNGDMWSLHINWDQKQCAPLPEKTGKIVAFTLGGLGYVVNQLPGIAPHVYAYDPEKDTWVRKADFPGKVRDQAIGFSAKGKGYFGLGIDAGGNGLRDLWEYNAEKNTWTYHSEYPGQGNQLLVTFSAENKAYLGWGYESRLLEGSAAKQLVGCTDFWEFNP